jgi:hypothetical protein
VKVNIPEFLQGVADSFQKTPREILLFILLLFILIFIYAAASFIRYLVDRTKLSKVLYQKYVRYLREFSVTQAERELIDALSVFLKTPEKKYLLFINQHTFNYCLNRLKRTSRVSNEILLPLVKKLGFDIYNPFHLPRTTREIAQGKPAFLVLPGNQRIAGIIERQLKDSLVFSVKGKPAEPFLGSEATLYLHNALGVLSFPTLIQNVKENEIFLEHSDTVTSIQRRMYYRKNIRLPILIRQEGSTEKPLRSAIIDISAGGMSVENPQKKYNKGDDLRLFFHENTGQQFDISGEVLRVTRNREVLHIRFGHLIESIQDRIMGFINIEKQAEQDKG